MRKLLLMTVGLAIVGMLASTALATSFAPGLYNLSAKDRSNLFSGGVPEGLGATIDPGDEQRNTFRIDQAHTGIKVSAGPDIWIDDASPYPYTNNALTGLLYDQVYTGDKVGGPGNNIGPGDTLPTDLYFKPGTRWTDAATGTGTDGLWTDTLVSKTFGPATTAGGFGGLIVIYDDPAINSDYAGAGGGPADWVEADPVAPAGQAVTDPSITTGYVDAFPTFTDVQPWLIMTLAPLPAWHGAPAGTTMIESNYNVNPITGRIDATGVLFGNIIGGSAATSLIWMQDFFGPGLDVRLDFRIEGSVGSLTSEGWQLSSEDPVQFGLLPEPGVMSLLGLGIVSLLGVRKIRKQK